MTGVIDALEPEVRDSELFQLALTHRSLGAKNYERLEFLGDAVLNMVVAEQVYRRAAEASEGDMTRLRAALVNEPALASVAAEARVGNHVRLGSSELKGGGARRESILADVVEAMIGAVYLLSGFARVKAFILALYGERLQNIHRMEAAKDPKTRLQEWLQQRGLDLPMYSLLKESGQDHAKTFYVCCESPALNVVAHGQGTSRRRAEQAAAQAVLEQLQRAGESPQADG